MPERKGPVSYTHLDVYKRQGRQQAVKLPESARVTLEEDNVLPLDMAEFRLDDGEWSEKEEILRLDNQIREELGYPRRADAYAQPWIYGKQEYEHRVSLRFHINSEIDITDVRLALENADITEVFWNNRKIEDPAAVSYTHLMISKFSVKSYSRCQRRLPL